MRPPRFQSADSASLAVLLLLTVGGCRGRETPATSSTAAVQRAECPHDALVIKVIDTTGHFLRTIDSIPLSEPITKIPEFHDCQRFIQKVGRYDSLYAIFAAFRLENLPATIKGAKDSAGSEGKAFRTAPVATIYSYGGQYDPLGIKPGFNCLFLYAKGEKWGAKLVPWGGSDDPDCADRRFDPFTSGKALEVRTTQSLGFADADYPANARWDWDPEHREQYIGIKCGPAWCEVGNPGFKSSGPYAGSTPTFKPVSGVTPSSPNQMMRVSRVKGWSDEPELEATATGPTPHPSGIRGALIPHPALEMLNRQVTDVKFFLDTWVHVADAVLDSNYKWNLKRGMNEIYFCFGAAAKNHCDVRTSQPPLPPGSKPLTDCDPDPNNPTMRWWGMIVSPDHEIAFTCVKRTDHSKELDDYRLHHPGVIVRIPGAARWRFLLDDEGTWMSCPSGCCTKS